MYDRVPPPTLRNRVTRATGGLSSVRRNLFQTQVTRRSTTDPTKRSSGTRYVAADVPREEIDIVVRDRNGEFEIENPPMLELEDLEEEVLDTMQENERERKRLAEAVRLHQGDQACITATPEEVLEVLKASMRAKVSALADDEWMFEPDESLPEY